MDLGLIFPKTIYLNKKCFLIMWCFLDLFVLLKWSNTATSSSYHCFSFLFPCSIDHRPPQRYAGAGHVTTVELILSARVPVLKVTDRGSRIDCDFSVGNRDGIAKSQFVRLISAIDERFRKLSFMVRELSHFEWSTLSLW